MAGVRRVAEDDEDGLVFLYVFRVGRFVAQGAGGAEQGRDFLVDVIERVREEDIDALVSARRVAKRLAEERLLIPRGKREADLEMRHGVRSHEQLEAEEPREQVLVN